MPQADQPRKRFGRIKKFLALGTLTLGGLVAALPWLASTAPARSWVVAQANATLAPAKLEVASVQLNWLGANRLSGVVLRDESGKALASAPRITIDRGLLSLAMSRTAPMKVRVEGLALDLERKADGSLDLTDALKPLLGGPRPRPDTPEPPREAGGAPVDFTLTVANGSLRLRSPELLEPVIAKRMGLTFRRPATKGLASWRLALGEPSEGDDATLEIAGEFDHRAEGNTIPNLSTKITGKLWPISHASGGLSTRGRLDGTLQAERSAAAWTLTGDARILGLDARGPTLGGDRLTLERVGGQWTLTETASGWKVGRLDVGCPLGSIKAGGELAPGASGKIEGRLDLAGLARQLPHLLRIRDGLTLDRGAAELLINIHEGSGTEATRLAIEAKVTDLVAQQAGRTVAIKDPATLSAKVHQTVGGFGVEKLAVRTPFLDATGSGDLERGLVLTATLDLAGLQKELRDLIDFGTLDLAGKGRLAADYRRGPNDSYAARFAAEVHSMKVAGLTADPIARERFHVDATAAGPIASSGFPQSWSRGRLDVKTDDLVVNAHLASKSDGPGIRIASLSASWKVPTIAGTTPTGAETDLVRLEAEGDLDPVAGLLELRPRADQPQLDTIRLTGDGLRVEGFRGKEVRINASLAGNLAWLDRTRVAVGGGTANDLAGAYAIRVGAKLGEGGTLSTSLTFESPDLSLPQDGGARRVLGPIALAVDAGTTAGSDAITFQRLSLRGHYGQFDVAGNLSELSTRRLADLQGTLAPNWPAVEALMAASVEPDTRILAKPRTFRVKGPLAGESLAAILQGLDAEVAFDSVRALSFGLQLAPTPLVVRCAGGRVAIDPIESTLNNGRVHLLPQVEINDKGAITFRLAPGSALEQVEINDKVSKSLLVYIAPVLHDATQVRGKVSINLDQADFPITGEGNLHSTVAARVRFDNVVFEGGPFTKELVDLVGKGKSTSIRLDEQMVLAVANGRIHEKGLAVPIGRNARIEIDGSVGFDKTLALRARVPVAKELIGNREGLDGLLEDLRVGVPIGGTINRPTIDRRALRVGLGKGGKSALKRQANDFLKGLVKPDDGASSNESRGR